MIKPLNDQVLIARADNPSTSEGGIVLPQTDEPMNGYGVVLAVGEKVDLPIKPEDTVLFSRYAGTEVTYQGETFLLVPGHDLLATA